MLVLRYTEQGTEKTHVFQPGKTLIGRLPSCELVLTDPGVSRHHASVRCEDGRCYIQDAGSRFGTFRNGQRINEEVELASGDKLQFGEVTAVLEQRVEEKDLLSEDHLVTEGPGTIFKKVATTEQAVGSGDGQLIRLLAEVGRTLLSSQSLPEVLNKVVDVAFSVVPAERAFLMLRESSDEGLSARVLKHRNGSTLQNATLSRTVVRRVMRERVAILASDATTDPGLGATDSIVMHNIRSFMCAPLWNKDDVIGVLYVDSPRSAKFGPADLDAFTALTNAAAVAIEQARLSTQLIEERSRRERLSRYHSPAVVSRILHGEDSGMQAQEREVTVMFCDIVGFTTLCEPLAPAEAAAVLNAFLTLMTDQVFAHDGTLDKFLGDALLAVFGAPFEDQDHALKAVKAAIAMRKALEKQNAQQEGQPLRMRIAIATGMALTGDIGSPRRREFTVLGDVVNTASRIEDEVAGPGEIAISAATYEKVKGKFNMKSYGSKTLRGRVGSLEVYSVQD